MALLPPTRRRSAGCGATLALVVAVVALGAAVLAGCSRDDFEDRTAVVTLGGGDQAFSVDACGRDGETVFVVARADDGAVAQVVLGLDADGAGVPDSSGLTVDADPTGSDTRVAAFGTESWARRGGAGDPPGTVEAAALRGSRIQLSGEVVPVDGDDRPVAGAEPTRFSFDARCDEQDDG